jgi:thioesterase domain-containing protein
VNDFADLVAELQATWHRDIPPAAAMAIGVAGYDGTTLEVGAPLAANRNVHGTAFAGSLFSICVLAGWGAVWLALRRHALSGLIVVADSRIRYRRAVASDVRCRCTVEPAAAAAAAAALGANSRAELALACTIESGGKLAVAFEGTYVVQAKPAH